MSSHEIDAYLASTPDPQRTTLSELRRTIAALIPHAEQGMAYGVPCFKIDGKGIAGFAAYRNHCSYLPMSGSITAELADELAGLVTSKGAIQFAVDTPLSADLVAQLVQARRREVERGGR